jgi:hypothetical protein
MSSLKVARKLIEADPNTKNAQVLAYLIVALEMSHEFLLSELYKMDYDAFKLALKVIEDWRIDRYYSSKVKLYDCAWQVTEKMPSGPSLEA